MPGLKLKLLGTGGVWATPVQGCKCSACQRANLNPEYKRNPVTALLQFEETTVLLDAGLEDLPERFPPASLDAILLTHFHMDHVLGLFRFRWHKEKRVPVFCPPDKEGSDDLLKHQIGLEFHETTRFKSFHIASLKITPVPLTHSKLCYGWLIETENVHIAYLTDTIGLPPETTAFLQETELDLVILDCAYPPGNWPHQNHNDLEMALEISKSLCAKKTVLTHLNHELDQFLIENDLLPENIIVTKDNAIIDLQEGSITISD